MHSPVAAPPWSPAQPPPYDHPYDHLAARYDRIVELLDRPLLDWLRARLPPRPPGVRGPDGLQRDGSGRRALDLGCGTGLHAQLLAEHHDEVLAVDRSAAMLRHARRRRSRPAITHQERDLRQVSPAQDGRFDLVLCSRVLHELQPPAAPGRGPDTEPAAVAVLQLIRGLVRPGGRLLLVDLVHPEAAAQRQPGAGPGPDETDPRWPIDRRGSRSAAWRGATEALRERQPVGEPPAGERSVGQRPVGELLRLLLDTDWLDHTAATRVWPAAPWHRLCRSVLPGARAGVLPDPLPFSPSSSTSPCATYALAWTAPEYP